MAFDQATRNRLQRFVTESRSLLADEFTRQLQSTYGMNPNTGDVAEINTLTGLTPHQQETAQLLRDTLVHYLANAEKGKEKVQKIAALERIVREQAFTVLNRLAALRMSEARGFLTESIAKGYESKGFQLFHRLAGTSLGETGDTYHHYLYSLFDEFSLDLAVLFDRFSVQGRLFPSQTKLLEILSLINHEEINQLWIEDETVGWIYQYFNSIEERRQMRAESQAPRNSRELAVRNQFFTPRYVVEFLTDNTLGRIWYEMTQGNTGLKTSCKYLVRRPNELFLAEQDIAPEQLENLDLSQEQLLQQTVYIEYRKLKDPRDIRMLDPACGSMHFGLYAFDLFEAIYSEAWDIEIAQGEEAFIREPSRIALTTEYVDKAELLRHVPRLIIEHNIHGVDIDPRAAQIAGLSLWLRAHNSWQKSGIKPVDRPKIQRSNIVCAEPMPGEKALLQEFTASLKPTVLGQLVEVIFEKMELAGEAGSLLKIEEEIQNAIAEAKQTWQDENKGLMQFADFAKIAKQRGELDFDVSDINDESFWEQAEQKILDALQDYAEKASTDDIGQKRLFSEDAVKGFAFIDLSRTRFDVVLMNPPFGASSKFFQKFSKKMGYQGRDLAADFITRAFVLGANKALVGAITTRTLFFLKGYIEWRNSLQEQANGPNIFLDLGYGVLDAAVETAAYTFCKDRLSDEGFYLDHLGNHQVLEINSSALLESNNKYIKRYSSFKKIERKPLCYWASESLLKLISKSKKVGDEYRVLSGGNPRDDTRFVRHWIEAKPVATSDFVHYSKGGEFSLYYYDVHLALRWVNNGEELKVHCSNYRENLGLSPDWRALMINYEHYFQAGITWPRRTSRLSFRFLPEGCVFGDKSPVIQSKDNDANNLVPLMAFLNSTLNEEIIGLMVGSSELAQSYEVGIVSSVPAFDINTLNDGITKKSFVQWTLFKELDSISEISHSYISFMGALSVSLTINESYKKLVLYRKNMVEKILSNQRIIDEYFSAYFGGNSLSKLNNNDFSENSIQHFSISVISYFIGVIFGRWNLDRAIYEIKFDEKIDPFNKIEFTSKGMANNNDTVAVKLITEEMLFEVGTRIWASDESWREVIFQALNIKNFKDYVLSPNGFFYDHLKIYTQSRRIFPIYWLLQTKNCIFSIYLYYDHLNQQTLFICINDFVEPKLDSINQDLTIFRNNFSRNKEEEKEFDRLSDLKLELEDFRDELLRIAKFWKPNLNDGVQITAAPLWRLFQHKPWQNKLKETWEQLEAGDYDWAHLAYSIWPARVLRKCHKDRSLAIAHEVENELWHEVEVIKGRSRAPVLEWQPKALSEAELAAYIQSKIQA